MFKILIWKNNSGWPTRNETEAMQEVPTDETFADCPVELQVQATGAGVSQRPLLHLAPAPLPHPPLPVASNSPIVSHPLA